MKLVCISDTHNRHDELVIPEGDVLIHSGDATNSGTSAEVIPFLEWLTLLPHSHKIFVPGNHDFWFEPQNGNLTEDFIAKYAALGVHILIDRGVEIRGVRFYGTPWVRRFGEWAFMRSEMDLTEKYATIPPHDVLVTHGPPFGVVDCDPARLFKGGMEHLGSSALLKAINRTKPTAVICGHIHEARGHGHIIHDYYKSVTAVFNVSMFSRDRKPYVHGAYVLDIQAELRVSLL